MPFGQKITLNSLIAITVALLSSFMAVTKVKDDNICQGILQAKSDSVDKWNEYQSKKIKHHLAELGRDQAEALLLTTTGTSTVKLQTNSQKYSADISKYELEEIQLQTEARGFEKLYNDLNFRDDQFDQSDAALSIALGMLAVTALTEKRWLLTISWIFSGFGVVMGFAGLVGWHLHPDWLSRLLS